jgi:cell division septum initiation protein DivIVA
MTTNDEPTMTRADASGAAARLLEVAARNADELLADAKAEAEGLLAAARAEAQQVRAGLEEERARHSTEIARLKQLEQEHRERVRRHANDLLAQIEAPPS